MKTYLIISLCLLTGSLQAQTDIYDQLKVDYDRLRKEEKQDSALAIARQMNAWALQNETDTSLRYAVSFRYLGNSFKSLMLSDSALYYYRKSISILNSQDRSISSDYASGLNRLGLLLFTKGAYKDALPYYRQALDIYKQVLGAENIDYAYTLNDIGILYFTMGDFKSCEFYLMQAKDIQRKVLGEEHPGFADVLSNLGALSLKMGDYKVAELYFTQASDIRKKILGEDHPKYADILTNLGSLYNQIGDYKVVEPYFKQALEIRKKALGEEHLDYASSLNNLAVLYAAIGNSKTAEHYYILAIDIKKKVLGMEHSDYGRSLINISTLYREMGNYESSELYCLQALQIYKKAFGVQHHDYAYVLNKLGNLYFKIGDNKLAESYFILAQEIYKNTVGSLHRWYESNETDYANLLTKITFEKQAYDILNKNFEKKTTTIANNFEWLTDNQKEAYWKKESSFYDNLSRFANDVYKKVPEAVGLNYNTALVTKSKMLEAKISSENYYREVDELREELAYRRRLLAKMESDGSTDKEKFEKLREEADSLDKRLTLSWPEYAQQKKNLSITWDQVQQNLNKGEAAIEFVRFENEDDSLVYYNALVLKKGDINPTLVKLCKEKDLQAITPKMGYSAYYPLVWEPLEEDLKGINTIYYAPTGELYNVPFHAIYSPKGKGDEILAARTDKRGVVLEIEHAITESNPEFLMDRYSLHQLTSTRYLAMGLKQKSKEPIGNTIAMVGGVNYDYLPGAPASSKKNKKYKNASRSGASSSGKLNYLEGTKTEVEQINNQVTTAKWQTKLIENNEAIEENITKLEAKEAKGILHLATHGYAFSEYDFSDTTISEKSLKYSYRFSTNPMVRSGLILAGGNWAWSGSDTLSKLGAEQNGILTALEVSQLNLKKTKLVVLSACETGLGKIEGSEGTFGLKRGFKLAGVEQMIVSLWSVPDKETMELMTLFYTDLTKTLNPVISFEKAQKEMRSKYPTEPEKWAGFVLVR